MGYYDHFPTVLLDKPLVLVGFMGAGVVATAMALGTTTGLNPVDLDSLVAHRAGHGQRGRAFPGGRTAQREAQLAALRAALRDRPFGVIALPYDLLADPRARALLQQQARVVYLRRDLLTLYGRVLDGLDRSPRRYPDLDGLRPTSAHDLMPLFAPLRPLYEAADHVLDVGREHPTAVAARLEALLSS